MSSDRSCPNCGSQSVSPDDEAFVRRALNPSTWKCEDCGYSGLMPELHGKEKVEYNPGSGSPNKSESQDNKMLYLFVLVSVIIPAITLLLAVLNMLF